MIGQYVERLKGWLIVCDVCSFGPLGHVSGIQDEQPQGYMGFFCAEHAPIIEPKLPSEE